jgi:hypothetical protein
VLEGRDDWEASATGCLKDIEQDEVAVVGMRAGGTDTETSGIQAFRAKAFPQREA